MTCFPVNVIGKRIKCTKLTLSLVATIFLLLAAGLLLSLIKYADINDLASTNKTIYYTGEDVTVLVGGVFDLRNYDKFEVSLISKAVAFEEYLGYASVCQAHCSPNEGMSHVIASITLGHHEAINISEDSRASHHNGYIKLVNTTDDTPSLYLLKGSEISFRLETPLLASSSEVILNIFSNVLDCEGFYLYSDALSYKGYTVKKLTTMNNFTSSHVMPTDDYICVVAQFPDYDIYTYSINGSVYQYHDISYLSRQNLCAFNNSLTRDIDGINLKITKSLDRSFKSFISLSHQDTCLLITIKSACAYTTCTFGLEWSIFATLNNPGIIITFGIASLVLIVESVLLSFLCLLCLKF